MIRVWSKCPLKIRSVSEALTWFASFCLCSFCVQAQTLAPSAGATKGQQGLIVVSVRFGHQGEVEECHVMRSNAPFTLEASTIDHIRKHWAFPFFADCTELVPINYDAPVGPNYWAAEMSPPPNFFPYDGLKYMMKLRLTFGTDGWVQQVKVKQRSGIDLVDRQTAEWIQAHWHHAAYAGHTVDAPFEFIRVAPKLPPVLPPKPKVAPTTEPEPIPAMRAL